MVIPVHFLDPVVHDPEHPTETVSSPHPLTFPDVLDRDLSAFRANESSLPDAGVTTRTQTIGVLFGVRSEDLGL